VPAESGVIAGPACVFPGLPGGLFRRFGTGLRRHAGWVPVMDKCLLRIAAGPDVAVSGPRPPRWQVSRPGHGGSAHAPARQTFRERSPGMSVRRPLDGRVKLGSQGTLGLFLTWPRTSGRRQITDRRRTEVTAPMATAPGVAHGTRPRKVLTGRQVAPDRVISTVAWHRWGGAPESGTDPLVVSPRSSARALSNHDRMARPVLRLRRDSDLRGAGCMVVDYCCGQERGPGLAPWGADGALQVHSGAEPPVMS